MECVCAQTRPRFILSSERVWGNGVRNHVNSKGKIKFTGKKISPEEYRTRDSASSRTASPTHNQRSIPAPEIYVSLCQQLHGAASLVNTLDKALDDREYSSL